MFGSLVVGTPTLKRVNGAIILKNGLVPPCSILLHLSKAICLSAYRRLTNRFCYGKCFFDVGGWGVIQESNYPFFKWKYYQRTLLVWKDFISNINLGQTNSLNFNKFGIGNNVPDCLLAPFTH